MAKYVELDKSLVNGEKHCLIMTDEEALTLGLLLGKTTNGVFTPHFRAMRGIIHKDWEGFKKKSEALDKINCARLEKELDKWEL